MAIGESKSQGTPVRWQSQVAITVSADGSVRSTSNASFASSAYSVASIAGNQNGYFEFSANNFTGLIGLSDSPQGGGFSNIDYAIQIWGAGRVYVVENNQQRGQKTTWRAGDRFRVEFTNGRVVYKKNGATFYTSTVPTVSRNAYFADFAFGFAGTGFDAPVISTGSAFWQEPIAVNIASDGSVRSTSDASFASSAYSIASIAGNRNGYFEFSANNFTGLIGLSDSPQGGGFSNIDYAIQIWGAGRVYVVENNQQRGQKTTWRSGDRFRVEISNGRVAYKKNGATFYTSTVPTVSRNAYFADFAFGFAGTGFDAPVITSGTSRTNENFAKVNEQPLDVVSSQLEMYPNPSQGTLYFNTPFQGQAAVANNQGAIVGNVEVQPGQKAIDLSYLKTGLYTLILTGQDGHRTTKKVMISR